MSTLELPAGAMLASRFRVVRRVGAGGMGAVFEAIDASMDRPVALKVLREGATADPQQLARFEREARAAARLSHPNVVGVSELVRDPGVGPILVMELLAGRSLATRILEEGALPEADVVAIGTQALEGLAAAHAAGMVHRDLKPSNVFLVPIAGAVLVKVLDFGIVKMLEEGALPKLTQRGMVIGTPAYMSPEQLRCDPVDARSDVYSMGACLYEALAGVSPYTAAHTLELIANVGRGPPRDIVERRPNVSPDLAEVVRVAMARDPEQRYQSAAAMRAALGHATLRKAGDAPRIPVQRARPDDVTIDVKPARPARPVVDLGVIEIPRPPATTPMPPLPTSRRPAMLASATLVAVLAGMLTWWAATSRSTSTSPSPSPSPSTSGLAPSSALASDAPSRPVPPERALPPSATSPAPSVSPPSSAPAGPTSRPRPAPHPRHVPTTAPVPVAPPPPPPPSRPVSPIGHELMDPFHD